MKLEVQLRAQRMPIGRPPIGMPENVDDNPMGPVRDGLDPALRGFEMVMKEDSSGMPLRSVPAFVRIVFACQPDRYTVLEVLAHAWYRGELFDCWDRLLTSMACVQRAGELGLEPGEGELQSLSDEFRYERDLLTSEEMERWLRLHDISEDDFCNYFLRQYWRQDFDEPPVIEAPFAAAPLELLNRLRADAILSGDFDRMVERLSWRVAAAHSETEPVAGPECEQERADFFARTFSNERVLTKELAVFGLDMAWFEETVRREVIYRRVCRRTLTPERRARALPAMRLALTAVGIETLTVSSSEAAREGVLCLNESRLTMTELARECGSVPERTTVCIGDLPEEMQQNILSASLGQCLPPASCEGGFQLCRMIEKKDPGAEEPQTAARLNRHLLLAHFSDLTRQCICLPEDERSIA